VARKRKLHPPRFVPREVQQRLDEPGDEELLDLLTRERRAFNEFGYDIWHPDRDVLKNLYRALDWDREMALRVMDRVRFMRAWTKRVRAGVWPPADHQRGTVTLPYQCGLGAPGDEVPAWVCCRCGAIELTDSLLRTGHGCCDSEIGQRGTCMAQLLQANHRKAGIAVSRDDPFNELWKP